MSRHQAASGARRGAGSPHRSTCRRPWSRVAAGVAGLALALAACGQPSLEVPPTPASIAAMSGVWAVSVVAADGEPALPRAPLGRGAAAGHSAKVGALGSVYAGAGAASGVAGSGPWGPILAAGLLAAGVVVAPVAAVVGAVGGAAVAASPEEIAAAEASMARALADLPPPDDLLEAVIAEADRRVGMMLVDCGTARRSADCTLADAAVPDVLLRLELDPPLFEIEGEVRPQLRLVQRLSAEIRPSTVVVPIHARAWVYRGIQHRYLELAADDARLLRQEFAAAREALVAKAVADLFAPGIPERHVERAQPEGSVWTVLPPGQPVRGSLPFGRR